MSFEISSAEVTVGQIYLSPHAGGKVGGTVEAQFTYGGAKWSVSFTITAEGVVSFIGDFRSLGKPGAKHWNRRSSRKSVDKVDTSGLVAAIVAQWREQAPTFDFESVTRDQLALAVKTAESRVQAAERALVEAQELLKTAQNALKSAY